MTPDEMPAGPELDRLVAERVMRYQPANGTLWADMNGSPRRGGDKAEWGDPRWSPSTNIAHAMEAVAAMRGHKNNWFCLNWYGDAEEWYAGQGDGTGQWPGIADTAPLAICRALLKAVANA